MTGFPATPGRSDLPADDQVVPYDQAIAEAGQVIVEDLMRQAERTPREAAIASLGRGATAEAIACAISRRRAHQPP